MNFRLLKDSTLDGNIELYSDKEVIVDGCKCIADYGADYIKLGLKNKNLKIRGANLIIDSFGFEQVDIHGKIVSLEFTDD